MEPMLKQGRDSVELGKAENIAVGDVVLYKRDSGQFVLHRIVGKCRKTYVMCGDHQGRAIEHGIRPDQILFKLVGFYTDKEYHSVDEKEYREYTQKRLREIPFFYKNKTLYTFLRKVKYMLIK